MDGNIDGGGDGVFDICTDGEVEGCVEFIALGTEEKTEDGEVEYAFVGADEVVVGIEDNNEDGDALVVVVGESVTASLGKSVGGADMVDGDTLGSWLEGLDVGYTDGRPSGNLLGLEVRYSLGCCDTSDIISDEPGDRSFLIPQ